MIPVFYINLDSRPDRRAFMEEQFARLGIAATRISASRPSDVPPEIIARYCSPRRYRRIVPAEAACTVSHLAACRAVRDCGSPLALVLEDDVELSPRLPERLRDCERPQPFDILRIEASLTTLRVSRHETRLAAGVGGRRATDPWIDGAAGYIISRQAATALLADDRIFALPFDKYIFAPHLRTARGFSILHCQPALCRQMPASAARSNRSDIEPDRLAAPQTEAKCPLWLRWVNQVRWGLDRELRLGIPKTLRDLTGYSQRIWINMETPPPVAPAEAKTR